DVAGAIRAAIIDEHDLLGNRHFHDAANQLAHPLAFVVNRNDDRYLEAFRNRIDAELSARLFAEEVPQHELALFRIRGQLQGQVFDRLIVRHRVDLEYGGHADFLFREFVASLSDGKYAEA